MHRSPRLILARDASVWDCFALAAGCGIACLFSAYVLLIHPNVLDRMMAAGLRRFFSLGLPVWVGDAVELVSITLGAVAFLGCCVIGPYALWRGLRGVWVACWGAVGSGSV